MNDELDTLDDTKLSEVFAVEVGGWTYTHCNAEKPFERGGYRLPNSFNYSLEPIRAWWHPTSTEHAGCYRKPPSFATDANAVLPYLFQCGNWFSECSGNGTAQATRIKIGCRRSGTIVAQALNLPNTFPRAACIALIRAKRAALT